MRGTAKAFLKLQEKRLENEKAQEQVAVGESTPTTTESEAVGNVPALGKVGEEPGKSGDATIDSQKTAGAESTLEVRWIDTV